MSKIVITASFNGDSQTTNVFSIENATDEVITELTSLIKNLIGEPAINVSLDVSVNGSSVASLSKLMTKGETAAFELGMVEALKTFIGNHSV